MKYLIVILLFILTTPSVLAKGGSGTYYITGIAYGGVEKVVLRNTNLVVKMDGKQIFIKTDDQGQFEIEVNWQTACPSGISDKEWKRETNKLNPEFIYVKHKDIEIKIKNDWNTYAKIFPESKKEVTCKKNLYFT